MYRGLDIRNSGKSFHVLEQPIVYGIDKRSSFRVENLHGPGGLVDLP